MDNALQKLEQESSWQKQLHVRWETWSSSCGKPNAINSHGSPQILITGVLHQVNWCCSSIVTINNWSISHKAHSFKLLLIIRYHSNMTCRFGSSSWKWAIVREPRAGTYRRIMRISHVPIRTPSRLWPIYGVHDLNMAVQNLYIAEPINSVKLHTESMC